MWDFPGLVVAGSVAGMTEPDLAPFLAEHEQLDPLIEVATDTTRPLAGRAAGLQVTGVAGGRR